MNPEDAAACSVILREPFYEDKKPDENKIKRKRQNENKNVTQVGEKLFNVKTYAR